MKVLCSGLNVVDVLVSTPQSLKMGHKNECDQIVIQGGAPAGNAACALSRLGNETYFLGYFGDNPISLVAKNELKKFGIRDDFFIEQEDASPAIAIVQIDKDGERTVMYSMNNYIPFSPKSFNDERIKQFDLILVDGYDTQINLHLLKLAKKYGIKSVLDMETGDTEIMKQLLAFSSDSILPLECAQNLTGKKTAEDCLNILVKMTDGQVVITDGANGAYTLFDGVIINQPAFKGDIVDTTGCGDSFHAAYASALLDGLDVKERMRYASFYAVQVAGHFGGRTFLPTKEFMKENFPVII